MQRIKVVDMTYMEVLALISRLEIEPAKNFSVKLKAIFVYFQCFKCIFFVVAVMDILIEKQYTHDNHVAVSELMKF